MMSLLGSLVAGVAHEVRNPLFGISSILDAFETRFSDRTEYLRYTNVLRDEDRTSHHSDGRTARVRQAVPR